jgi:tetratricopeptide (TPR) repeat protein
MAMQAKSLALKVQADRIEQTDARKKAVMAESDRLSEQAQYTNADGSAIAKTVEDEWREQHGLVFPGSKPDPQEGTAVEKFVAAHPDFLPARMWLGTHYQDLGDGITDAAASSAAARTQHFKDADAQFARALTLAHDSSEAGAALSARIGLLGTDRLNRPAEAETLARSAIARYPDQPSLVIALAGVLLPRGTVPTDAAVRRLREAAPATPEAQHAVGTCLWEIVYRNKELPRPVAAKVLTEATSSLDAALKMRPDYMEAMVYKSIVLRLRAERVEQDPARIKALLAEADRLKEQAVKLRSGGK